MEFTITEMAWICAVSSSAAAALIGALLNKERISKLCEDIDHLQKMAGSLEDIGDRHRLYLVENRVEILETFSHDPPHFGVECGEDVPEVVNNG